jgi:hypothetical protein
MSPQELLDRLVLLFPEFAACWDGPGNYFRDDDRTFTPHGAFAVFSHFFKERYEHLPKDRIAALADFLSECMADPHSDLDNAAATCFLENVAGERFSGEFRGYLRGEPLAYYSQWDRPA